MLNKIRHTLIIIVLCFCATAHATTIQPGDLLITEVMANPTAVSDTNGEWFEIFNQSSNSIDLNRLTISDDGSNTHQINSSNSLLIAPGAYFVFGHNGDSISNGGYLADYVYNNFSLGNTTDQIVLSDNGNEIARLNYTGLPFGSAGASAELVFQLINPD